jgi:hypothetical protein
MGKNGFTKSPVATGRVYYLVYRVDIPQILKTQRRLSVSQLRYTHTHGNSVHTVALIK